MDDNGEKACGSTVQKASEPVEIEEDLDADVNIDEIMKIDEILTGSGKMLDFEKQMFLDCVYNDALTICGK